MPLMLFLVLWQLHTTQKSQVFPLSLQLKGQPARYLDSPAPMTGGGPHLPHVATGDSVLMGGALPWGDSASAHCTVTDVLSCHSLTHRFSELSLAHLYLVTGSVFIHWAAPLGQASLC